MPTIGWFEILIIVVVAIIILGPKDFPLMLKKVGSWIGNVKRYVNSVQNEVSSITEDTIDKNLTEDIDCLLYTSPSPRDISGSRMPSSA